MIGLCSLLGPWLDWLLVRWGAYAYVQPAAPLTPAPAWIIALWALLAMTLRHCLGWLGRRPGLALFFGAVGGPLSYAAGARMGALKFGEPLGWACALMGVGWGLAMPFLFRLAGPPRRADG